MEDSAPTRTNLLQRRAQVQLAVQGVDLLKNKRDVLIREFMKMMDEMIDRRHDLELVKQLVGQHIKRLGMYKCDHCGFRARQYYWRCPGCGRWETYSPRRTETPDGFG